MSRIKALSRCSEEQVMMVAVPRNLAVYPIAYPKLRPRMIGGD
jgi:hypothetical protein